MRTARPAVLPGLRAVASTALFTAVTALLLSTVQSSQLVPARLLQAQPGRSSVCGQEPVFMSWTPPAPAGQWDGDHGFFEIPGTLDFSFCGPGTLTFRARGDVATNGGPPLLVVRSDVEERTVPVRREGQMTVDIGPSGRLTLAFPNDETDAAYTILAVERLSVTGPQRCESVLVRDAQQQTFDTWVTFDVYDLAGQVLLPCQPGELRLTVNGSSVLGVGPRLNISQAGRSLLQREITGRHFLRLPLDQRLPVRLSVTNFLAKDVKYRNLFLSELRFQPASAQP